MIHDNIAQLLRYALEKELILPDDYTWAANRLTAALGLDRWEAPEQAAERPLEDVLRDILDWAVANGRCEPGIASRDILDTELMGILTPRPSEVRHAFWKKYAQSPEAATDWYYTFCQDTDYIRRYRIAKDMKWVAPTEYGELDITVNLSKPEKDPRAIAAAKLAPQNAYPACQLCASNEGYQGRLDHPARQNHRLIPLTLDGQDWFFQYSPYVYYNEHCIVLNSRHIPMKIDRSTFRRQMDFLKMFPHYFIGSNADLPIVGGSILSHDHFQGGRYTFAMARAPEERTFTFPGFEDVQAGVVKWPMSVIRLRAADPDRLVDLADRVLLAWRGWSDPAADILAETGGERHNTVTPIARMRGDALGHFGALRAHGSGWIPAPWGGGYSAGSVSLSSRGLKREMLRMQHFCASRSVVTGHGVDSNVKHVKCVVVNAKFLEFSRQIVYDRDIRDSGSFVQFTSTVPRGDFRAECTEIPGAEARNAANGSISVHRESPLPGTE